MKVPENHGGDKMDDNKIVQLYLERSEDALNETAKKYGKLCYSVAYGILSSHEDAEECVNTAYMHTWNSIPPQKPKHFSAFLCKIVRNLALDCLERFKSEKRGGKLIMDELSDAIPDTSGESIADTVAMRSALNGFLRRLPTRERKIFLGRYWYCLDIRSLSRAYGESESNIKAILYRTRLALKAHLEDEGIVL